MVGRDRTRKQPVSDPMKMRAPSRAFGRGRARSITPRVVSRGARKKPHASSLGARVEVFRAGCMARTIRCAVVVAGTARPSSRGGGDDLWVRASSSALPRFDRLFEVGARVVEGADRGRAH